MTARRYNNNKIRLELIPEEFEWELGKVFTMGADKYTIRDEEGNIIDDGANNWRKGLAWKSILASVYRHLNKFERGEDFDTDWPADILEKYGPSYHLANAAWGISVLMNYYKAHPELDDRQIWWKKPFKKIFFDLDGVLCDFEQHFLNYFKLDSYEPHDWADYRFVDNLKNTIDNEDFWLSAPMLSFPEEINYPIAGYCTARSVSVEVIQKWLDNNKFPRAKICRVDFGESKVEKLKDAGCEIMLDDSIHNFVELNSNGIVCYLYSRPHNEKYNVGYRRCNSIKEFLEKIS